MSFQNQPSDCDCGCDRRRREALRAAALNAPAPPDPCAELAAAYVELQRRFIVFGGEQGAAPAPQALDVERVGHALRLAWLDSNDAYGHALPPDLAGHLAARLSEPLADCPDLDGCRERRAAAPDAPAPQALDAWN